MGDNKRYMHHVSHAFSRVTFGVACIILITIMYSHSGQCCVWTDQSKLNRTGISLSGSHCERNTVNLCGNLSRHSWANQPQICSTSTWLTFIKLHHAIHNTSKRISKIIASTVVHFTHNTYAINWGLIVIDLSLYVRLSIRRTQYKPDRWMWIEASISVILVYSIWSFQPSFHYPWVYFPFVFTTVEARRLKIFVKMSKYTETRLLYLHKYCTY